MNEIRRTSVRRKPTKKQRKMSFMIEKSIEPSTREREMSPREMKKKKIPQYLEGKCKTFYKEGDLRNESMTILEWHSRTAQTSAVAALRIGGILCGKLVLL